MNQHTGQRGQHELRGPVGPVWAGHGGPRAGAAVHDIIHSVPEAERGGRYGGRGLHSSTFQLNLSRF